MLDQITNLIQAIIIPLMGAGLGYCGYIFVRRRNKDEIDKDKIANLLTVIDAQTAENQRAHARIDSCELKIQNMNIRLGVKNKIIHCAFSCDAYKNGQKCPVLEKQDELENVKDESNS